MTREIFHGGWSHRTKVTAFQELGGANGSPWTSVTLPHDALIGATRTADAPHGETNGYFPSGAFEYRTTFAAPEADRGKQLLLEFDGVYRDARVYVNGALAGQHANGYSRFTVRIDPFLEFGADNEIRVDCRTHLDSRWYAGAGIYRDVHLITKNPTHIAVDGVTVTTVEVDEDRAVMEVAADVENSGSTSATLTLSASIPGAAASARSPITLLPGSRGTVRLRMYVANPALWSVDSPNLYDVAIELRDGDDLLDAETVAFGIRTLQLDPHKGLRINGETVKLRGACIHADNGPLGAVSVYAAEERKIRKLKDAGFNAIRSAHHPAGSALLDACDRLGMLVMDETFDMWTSSKSDFDYSFDFVRSWEADVEAMVARDINHPSVILYSIGNEIPETGNRFGAIWGRRLAEKIRSLDPTRYVTNGINGFVSKLDVIIPMMQQRRQSAPAAGGVNEMMAGFGQMMSQIQAASMVTDGTEEAYAVLDVAGMNYGDARYELDRELFPNRVIVGAETWPADIDKNWKLVEGNGHVIGDFTWTGWDYLGETGIGVVQYAEGAETATGFSTGFPGLTAWSGDIDITGERRPVSFWRETVFGLRSEPYIAVHRPEHHGKAIAVSTPWSWSDSIGSWSWPGFEGEPVVVEVYSDADEVELLLNGTTVARANVGETKAFRADFELTYQPGELVAVAYIAGVESGRSTLVSAADARVVVAASDREELRADADDLAFVAINLTDGAGRVHAALDRPVTVTVTGAGELVAFGSANPVTEETFGSTTHDTFDGHALAIIRATGPGAITVSAEATGFEASIITITAS